jgi:hypothetical protein
VIYGIAHIMETVVFVCWFMPAEVGDELQQRITSVNEGIIINQRGGAMP